MAVYLQGKLFASPQFLGFGARPTYAVAVAGVDHFRADLLRRKGQLKTMIIFSRHELPHNPREDPVGIGGFLEHIFESPLTLRIAITGNLHKNAVAVSAN
jgi:hypothetical protein